MLYRLLTRKAQSDQNLTFSNELNYWIGKESTVPRFSLLSDAMIVDTDVHELVLQVREDAKGIRRSLNFLSMESKIEIFAIFQCMVSSQKNSLSLIIKIVLYIANPTQHILACH